MSRKYKIHSQSDLYFVTFTVIEWIDVFTRKDYRDIFIESVRYCQEHKQLEVYAYVIMSNHIHMIVRSGGTELLQDIIRDLKKYTSVKITAAIRANEQESRKGWMVWILKSAGEANVNNKNFQFWQQHNQPKALIGNEMIDEKLNYIHQNPVKAGIVLSAEEYLYSSAKNYAGLPDVLLKVDLL